MNSYLKHLFYFITIILVTLCIASFTVIGSVNKNITDVSIDTPTINSSVTQELQNSLTTKNSSSFTDNTPTDTIQPTEIPPGTIDPGNTVKNFQTLPTVTQSDLNIIETENLTLTVSEVDPTRETTLTPEGGNNQSSIIPGTRNANQTTKVRTVPTVPLKPNIAANVTKIWSPTPIATPSAIRSIIVNPVVEDATYPETTKDLADLANNYITQTEKSPDLWTIEPETPTAIETISNLTDPDVWYDRGLLLEKEGKYEEAILAYDNALAIDPAYVEAWFQKGLTLEKLGRDDEALIAYNTTLDLNPLYKGALDNRNLLMKNLIAVQTTISSNLTSSNESAGDEGGYPWIYLVFGGVSVGIFLALLILLKFGIGSGNVYKKPSLEKTRGKYTEYETREKSSSYIREPRKIDIYEIKNEILTDSTVDPKVFENVLTIAIELGREGREGKSVGTSFIIGDSENVLLKSKQLILNPFEGHHKAKRSIHKGDLKENIKELAQLDGAFVISDDGTVEAAGRYITIDTSDVKLPRGFGTRHASIAAISKATKAIGIVLSQSGGTISIFKDGEMKKKIRY